MSALHWTDSGSQSECTVDAVVLVVRELSPGCFAWCAWHSSGAGTLGGQSQTREKAKNAASQAARSILGRRR